MEQKICPRCFGNGYIMVAESVENPKKVPAQCTMCDSQGEINEVDSPNDADTDDRLQ